MAGEKVAAQVEGLAGVLVLLLRVFIFFFKKQWFIFFKKNNETKNMILKNGVENT